MTVTCNIAIRNAATIIVLRNKHKAPSILMGQRGSNAVFMPNKFVFPGGAVDPSDASIRLVCDISNPCHSRLNAHALEGLQSALCVAAVRELWEETGLILGAPGQWVEPVPSDWRGFANMGYLPTADSLKFVFRAITPPGRPRRFDARFFLVDSEHICSDLDDFSHASDELQHLQWVSLTRAREFDLPFITEVVLAEIENRLSQSNPPPSVPFFMNNEKESIFLRI
ncbi:MAG: NUDIX hydrolase [Aestuariivita sp.]|nr:NUDIX hydrolase [Aestuariivita sp.]